MIENSSRELQKIKRGMRRSLYVALAGIVIWGFADMQARAKQKERDEQECTESIRNIRHSAQEGVQAILDDHVVMAFDRLRFMMDNHAHGSSVCHGANREELGRTLGISFTDLKEGLLDFENRQKGTSIREPEGDVSDTALRAPGIGDLTSGQGVLR